MRAKKPVTAKPSAIKLSTVASTSKVTDFPIIGIGASAGGLEAFEQFFRHCPSDIGMAFILVPHLDPSHASLLSEILQRATSIPVAEAIDQVIVKPNHVYIIPPNRDIGIFHGKLQLSTPAEPRGQRMPIDAFFRSLSEEKQENAVGIILSGTGSDGTLGLRAIQGAGGVTLVQEPTTANYDGMPTSAIKAGYATKVLPVGKMPEFLLTSAHRTLITAPSIIKNTKSINDLSHILMQLRSITGHDFSLYKKSTIGRRVERRMLQHDISDTETYARYLKEHPAEAHLLFKEMLINVTSFFRDTEAYELLQKDILPALLKDKLDDYVLRIWVAGCSTGEEAYSIAILLRELLTKSRQPIKVQIFATDLDDEAITMARTGLYPMNISQDISLSRLRQYFTKVDSGYLINKEIREMIVFAVQNIIKDPPFTKLDLISCRNLMIYLEPELQNRLIPMFHFSLKPGGILFLSPSEGIGNHTQLFTSIDRKWKFYRAINSTTSTKAVLSSPITYPNAIVSNMIEVAARQSKEINLTELSQRWLAQYFAPSSVVTNTKGDILYVHGETGKYLRPAPGQASLNVIEMAREGLETNLRTAIYSAANESKPTLNREMQVKTNGGYTTVSLCVRPVPNGIGDKQNFLLVSFQDIASKPSNNQKKESVAKSSEPSRIEELEQDLKSLRENHQIIIAETQTTNEELKSANEELQSTNEELQSTNEELETSKEELQSVNEELITVNSEMQSKIEELTHMQNDMKNLLEGINIGIIFLDNHLNIRSFTREAVRVYRLVPSDVGRPLDDIRSVADKADELTVCAQGVLETLVPYESELQIQNSWIQVRIQPYRTLDNFIDGIVITFSDITFRIQNAIAQEALRLSEGIVKTIREPFIVIDSTFKIITASNSYYQTFKVKEEDAVGHQIYEINNQQLDIPEFRKLLEQVMEEDKVVSDFILEIDTLKFDHNKMALNARRIISKIGEPQLILISIEVVK